MAEHNAVKKRTEAVRLSRQRIGCELVSLKRDLFYPRADTIRYHLIVDSTMELEKNELQAILILGAEELEAMRRARRGGRGAEGYGIDAPGAILARQTRVYIINGMVQVRNTEMERRRSCKNQRKVKQKRLADLEKETE